MYCMWERRVKVHRCITMIKPWEMVKLVILSNTSFSFNGFKIVCCKKQHMSIVYITDILMENLNIIGLIPKQSLTLYHIHQICSKRLTKYSQKMGIISINNSIIVENSLAKGEIVLLEQFILLSVFSKVVCCRCVRKHLYMGKS